MKEYRLEQFISFLIYIPLIFFVVFYWTISISQTKDFVVKKPLLKVPFSVFKKQFELVEWMFEPRWSNSLFTKNYYDSQIHSGILKINDSGYVLTFLGFLKAKILIRRKINELKRDCKPLYEYKFS